MCRTRYVVYDASYTTDITTSRANVKQAAEPSRREADAGDRPAIISPGPGLRARSRRHPRHGQNAVEGPAAQSVRGGRASGGDGTSDYRHGVPRRQGSDDADRTQPQPG